MQRCYDILLGEQRIGTAKVMPEGLYYHFQCVCRLSGEVMYQLKAVCGQKETSLGICVPVPGGFGVDTKIPVKTVGEGEFTFYAAPRHKDVKGKFVPIHAEEPFMYMERLADASLSMENGQPGIWIGGM